MRRNVAPGCWKKDAAARKPVRAKPVLKRPATSKAPNKMMKPKVNKLPPKLCEDVAALLKAVAAMPALDISLAASAKRKLVHSRCWHRWYSSALKRGCTTAEAKRLASMSWAAHSGTIVEMLVG